MLGQQRWSSSAATRRGGGLAWSSMTLWLMDRQVGMTGGLAWSSATLWLMDRQVGMSGGLAWSSAKLWLMDRQVGMRVTLATRLQGNVARLPVRGSAEMLMAGLAP